MLSGIELAQAQQLLASIQKKLPGQLAIMEVCGTHTTAISKYGLRPLLEPLRLLSGPGCPVCVTAAGDLDRMIALAGAGCIVATFGDLLRVPGSKTSLEQEQADGADVRIVYSPLDALKIAANNRQRPVVFLGVGFETTAPAMALAVKQAKERGLTNFYLYSCLKTVVPALHALLAAPHGLDGLLLPGHVSSVIGRQAQDFVASLYGMPAAVVGFGERDILLGIAAVVRMIEEGKPGVINAYPRVVREEGNLLAQKLLAETFNIAAAEWRGFGVIPASGYVLKPEFAGHDAALLFDLPHGAVPQEQEACRCGDVLRGAIIPTECALFAGRCLPLTPLGPCMVSSEGACAAYYRYDRKKGVAPA
ncbi:MAG: hydrogenase formation protein HypD [Dethiobacter sp.]|jgi:hydrogenase expression/formation protein HypD|nr:hydrogenase formation protein HypD [Dethiobacter sp.]MBS3900895.1 hydrogenase formation protein HypD [Dethiobacter sp.]MBS3988429.1 hydrogenase formation protein HypD [Dethiobacter sp.]